MRKLYLWLCAVALIAGACSSGPESVSEDVAEDPKAALVSAVEALDGTGITMAFTLQSTPESLQALAADSGDELDGDTAQKILASSISVSSNGADNPREAIGQILVNIAGNDAFEMRIIKETIYLRADVRSILETFGQDASSLDMVAQQAAAGGLEFVGPAIDGEWLALRDYLETFEQLSGQPIPTKPTKEQQQAAQQLADALKSNATVTTAGEDEAGTHVVVNVPLRETYKEISESGFGLGAGLPPGALPPASEVPDKDISFDAWISDGRLSQVEFDFLQLAATFGEDVPENADELALRVSIEEFSGDVPAPDGAIAINLQEILGGFLGGLGGLQPSVDSGSAVVRPGKNAKTDFPCHYLEGEPRAVLVQFKDECPHLLRR